MSHFPILLSLKIEAHTIENNNCFFWDVNQTCPYNDGSKLISFIPAKLEREVSKIPNAGGIYGLYVCDATLSRIAVIFSAAKPRSISRPRRSVEFRRKWRGHTNREPLSTAGWWKEDTRERAKGREFQRSQGLVNKIMARQRCCEVASIDFKLNTLFPWRNKGSVAFT